MYPGLDIVVCSTWFKLLDDSEMMEEVLGGAPKPVASSDYDERFGYIVVGCRGLI